MIKTQHTKANVNFPHLSKLHKFFELCLKIPQKIKLELSFKREYNKTCTKNLFPFSSLWYCNTT